MIEADAAGAPTEHDIESIVDEIRLDPARRDELVDLLREDAAIYAGRGAAAATRIRGWIMSTFEAVGTPAAALPYILENLESDLDPYSVAAAAKAVRGMAEPAPFVAAALVNALARLRARDDTVTFESLRPSWPVSRPTTALLEVLASIRWLGDAAADERLQLESLRREHAGTWSAAVRHSLSTTIDALPTTCCAHHHTAPTSATIDTTGTVDVDVDEIVLEDQDGTQLTFADYFKGRTAIVAFFYTRCPNPNKCSLTITKLAELHRRLDAEGLADQVAIAAITYDSGYDLPARMRTYGKSRGLPFGDSVRMFRVPDQHEMLQRHFGLRVGYVGSIVNRHAIELFLVDADGNRSLAWTRLQWDVEDVTREAARSASVGTAARRPGRHDVPSGVRGPVAEEEP